MGLRFMFFRQVKPHGDNFSYVVGDEVAGEAAVVDASFNVDGLVRVLGEARLRLKFIVCTHGHADHVAGNLALRSALGGLVVAHSLSKVRADLRVDDGDVLRVGSVEMRVLYTPGHTVDGICLLVDGKKLLTGDTLFVGESGRTDLAGGDAASMYDSLFGKILKFDDAVEVYPGHDYGSSPSSTIGDERRLNYTLQPRSKEEFVEFMKQP